MTESEKHLNEILKALDEANILKDIILIGSWSLVFYRGIFLNFKPTIRTVDVDFFVPDTKKIKESGSIVNSLKELNYDLVQDVLTNKTRFISPDGFELEFLTRLNRNNLRCIKLGNTGIYAESLAYTDIFSMNYIEVGYNDIIVKVASPASYVLQKLLINVERKQKAEKDIESIKEVLIFIKASQKSFAELTELFNSLPKSWKRKIQNVANSNSIELLEPLGEWWK